MGYRKLTGLYDRWSEAIRNALERLAVEDDTFMPAFLAGCMQATVDDIRRCFPKLKAPADDSAVGPAGEKPPETPHDAPHATAGMAADLLDAYAEAAEGPSDPGIDLAPNTDISESDNLFDRLSQSFDRRMTENQIHGSHAPSGLDWELFSEDRPRDTTAYEAPLPVNRLLDEEDPLSAYVTASATEARELPLKASLRMRRLRRRYLSKRT